MKNKQECVTKLMESLGSTHKKVIIQHDNKSSAMQKRRYAQKIKMLRELGAHPYSPKDLTFEV
jgi:hypothetical protein